MALNAILVGFSNQQCEFESISRPMSMSSNDMASWKITYQWIQMDIFDQPCLSTKQYTNHKHKEG